MRTPASIAGHPIHPMLIVFPVGLLIFSLVCDLGSLANPGNPNWANAALYGMVGGFIGALAAAIPGLIDVLSVVSPKIKKIGYTHMGLNLTAVVLYGVNLWLRFNGTPNTGAPLLLSVIGVGILAISGWLGAEMVHRHGVGVDIQP